MAIDPTTTTTVRVGELGAAAFNSTDLVPHEVSGVLKKGTLQDLATFIGSIISVDVSVGFRAVQVNDGETLPATDQQEFILVGPGTYPNVGGGATITTTGALNALVSNGVFWFIGVEIPIEVSAIWGDINGVLSDQTDLNDILVAKADLVGGKVPNSQLPSYVDDVIEVNDYASLPSTGETGKIYVTKDTGNIYRWSGSAYIRIADESPVWGIITGTLPDQTDLQEALDGKFDNPTGDTTQYIAGDGSLITFPVAGQAGTLVRLVRNNSGATITKGTVVYINGASGNNPTIAKALATGDSTSAQTFGLVQADISNNSNGYVVVTGDLIGVNTSAITEGSQLYLSSTTAGAYTTTKQLAPAHLVYIGVVTRSHASLGQIEVKIQNGYELDEIHDVAISSKTNKDFLVYESSTDLWKNKSLGTILGGTSSQFIKGDGSLDSSTYLTSLSGAVLTTTDQSIAGVKTFTNLAKFTNGTGLFAVEIDVTAVDALVVKDSGTTKLQIGRNGEILAAKYKVDAGSASQFLKANGSLDSNTYALDNSVVHLAGSETITGIKTFTGSSTVFDYTGASRLIFKESGTEVGDFSFSPYFTQFTSKASGGYLFKNSVNANSLYITDSGNGTFLGSLTATSIIKSGGTSSQYLMADGSVSTLTNPVTASSATANYHAKFTGSGYAIGNSIVWDNGTNVGIGTTSPSGKLSIVDAYYNTFFADSSSQYGSGLILSGDAGSDQRSWKQFVKNGNGGVALTFEVSTSGVSYGSSPTGLTYSEKMRITKDGNVGIGTTSPYCKLAVGSATSANGEIGFIPDFEGSSEHALVSRSSSGFKPLNIEGETLKFWTGSSSTTEKMRITSGGNVGIGTTSPSAKLDIASGDIAIHYGFGIKALDYTYSNIITTGYDGTWGDFLDFYTAGNGGGNATRKMRIAQGGSVLVYSLGTGLVYSNGGALTSTNPSDSRLKDDITDLQYGLNEILKLRPVSYNWKNDTINQGKQFGFIAQEVQEVMPELVKEFETEDGQRLGLDKEGIYAALVNAIQELKAEIEILKNK